MSERPSEPVHARGLGRAAFEPPPEGQSYQPLIPATESPAEFTFKAVVFGILFGVVFGAANAYLGLVAGLTISTSIPVAVLTVAAFRVLRSLQVQSSLLEANLAQTIGSASSSVASGVIFTLPALFLWNLDPTLLQMVLLALCGGLLGVLFMVPLRRYLIDREHGKLPYPEGTACAEVLVASRGEAGGSARNVFYGLGAGILVKTFYGGLKLLPETVKSAVPLLPKGELGLKLSSALFGVGFILGPRIGAVMVSGALLSSLVLIPGIFWLWGGRPDPVYPELVKTVVDMSPSELWNRYVRYIGAGAVATAGLITLVKSIPTMIQSFKVGAEQLQQRLQAGQDAAEEPRTRQDLPLKWIGVAVAGLALVMAAVPQIFGAVGQFPVRLVAAILVVIFAFFFVTVSSRIVGLVGVTSNPTSGMTIAALLATSSIFLLMGWTNDLGKVAALTVGCVVAIAASIAGDTSQDLKTGFLLGATPKRQQVGELIGVLTSATFVCLTVILLGNQMGFGSVELPAPQATLMKLVIDGVLQSSLPWGLVAVGAGLAVVAELLRIPSLPFAVGIYLPVTTLLPLFLGSCLRWYAEARAADDDQRAERREAGVLFGSGLVGGEGLTGVGIAAVAGILGAAPPGIGSAWAGGFAKPLAVVGFAAFAYLFWRLCRNGGRR